MADRRVASTAGLRGKCPSVVLRRARCLLPAAMAAGSLINRLRSPQAHGRLSSDISSDKPVFLASVTGHVPRIHYSDLR